MVLLRTRMRERYTFDTVAGRYIVLSFLAAGWSTGAEALLQGIWSARERFDDSQLFFFGVRNNPPELFLNFGEYEGAFLRFPEYGNALYAAPPAGPWSADAPCFTKRPPVKRGRRYLFLPFLYDNAAARLRSENLKYLEPGAVRDQDLASVANIPPDSRHGR